MSKDNVEELEKIAEKLGDNIVSDVKKLLKGVIPSWFELRIQQGLKPVKQIEERQDRMEQEIRQQGKDLERLLVLYEQQAENTAEIKINTDELPKKVESVVTEKSRDLTGALGKQIQEVTGKKPKFLNKLLTNFKKGKK